MAITRAQIAKQLLKERWTYWILAGGLQEEKYIWKSKEEVRKWIWRDDNETEWTWKKTGYRSSKKTDMEKRKIEGLEILGTVFQNESLI